MRGLAEYQTKIAELFAAYPDLRLELIDSATVPGKADGEELVYLHYVGRATDRTGRSRFAAWTGCEPERESWSKTSSATTRRELPGR